MDWIRRNWPDLLIGIALLAVIAGIIATLLNGGSFFSFGRTDNPPVIQAPATPVTSPSSSQPAATPPVTDDNGVTPAAPGAVTPVAPGASSTDASSTNTPTGTPPTTETAGSSNAITPVAPGSSAPSTDTTAPSSTPTSSASSSLPTDPFRIGVGSFGDPSNAERRAETFREAGYLVFTAQQGQYTVVLVGPYDSRSEAEAAQADIRASGIIEEETILYELESETANTAPTSASETEAASSVETAVSGEGTYIQVGAYNSDELAAPQRERLEELGFTAILRDEPGSAYVKVWVGPFPDERLSSVQSQLNELGVDNFVPAQ